MTGESLGYQYVVLRLVPDIAREEFLNAAVVLHCQAADFLDISYAVQPERWRALSAEVDSDEVTRSLEVISRVCAGDQLPGLPEFARVGQRFGWIAAPRSTILQPGPTHGGTTDSPAAELDRLTHRLVQV